MHPLLRARADRQFGLFTALDARRAGYEHGEIRHLCSSGAWTRVRRGVYALTGELAVARAAGRAHAVDCTAVVLDLGRPALAVSHSSALRLVGLPARRALLPDTVRLTDPELYRRGKGFTVNRAPLALGDVEMRGPLRLTTPARTLVDCARQWPLEDTVIAMDAALLKGLVTPADLTAAVAAARSWPGAPRAARAAGLADGRAESPLETRGRLRMLGAGFPVPELQVEIRLDGRLLGVADAWFEEAAVAVEFDGRVKYSDPWRGRSPEQVLWEEKRREDRMRSEDIRVVRIVDADLDDEPGWAAVEGRLRALLAVPGPDRRRFTTAARTQGLVRAG
ncbi:type IV toxin-antitoxin system AbiEi family antitoxin domain-containing protein [Blastococcus sp. SYSU D01042]